MIIEWIRWTSASKAFACKISLGGWYCISTEMEVIYSQTLWTFTSPSGINSRRLDLHKLRPMLSKLEIISTGLPKTALAFYASVGIKPWPIQYFVKGRVYTNSSIVIKIGCIFMRQNKKEVRSESIFMRSFLVSWFCAVALMLFH